MSAYTYSALDNESQEIRLLTLLPGNFDDSIRITINHVSISPHQRSYRPPRNVTQELLEKLPAGWRVSETLEGRFIYYYMDPDRQSTYSSWTHPDHTFHINNDNEDRPEEVPTSSKLKYEALSYTWGSADNAEDIFVERAFAVGRDSLTTRRITIRQNLACALRYLRYTEKPRTLWIDSICINQLDLEERGNQVPRMGSIYHQADRVLVWLGPETENSTLAISTLEYLGRQVEAIRNYGCIPSPDCTEGTWWRDELSYNEKTWQAIFDLLGFPWFRRVWIIQEIHLANSRATMICGTQEILWSSFRRSIICLFYKRDPPPKLRERIHTTYELCGSKADINLPALLRMSTLSKCKEPADKLYGILCLAPPAMTSKIRPNYNLPFREIFKGAFLDYVSIVRRLELWDSGNMQQLADMPSWVPNWSVASEIGPLRRSGVFAGGMSASHTSYEPPDILQITGVCCSTVLFAGGLQIQTYSDLLETANSVAPTEDIRRNGTYMTGEPLMDAYASTLSLHFLDSRLVQSNNDSKSLLSFETLKDMMVARARSNRLCKYQSANNPYDKEIPRIKGWRYLSTKEGYIGFAFGLPLPGDFVCVPLGCHFPIILRRMQSHNYYKFVGICCLYGIMDSEALLGPLPCEWEARAILDKTGTYLPRYWNKETDINTQEDPRLGDFPVDWEKIEHEWTPDDPKLFAFHRNKVTGELINSDPRMLPEALAARGVKVEQFRLI